VRWLKYLLAVVAAPHALGVLVMELVGKELARGRHEALTHTRRPVGLKTVCQVGRCMTLTQPSTMRNDGARLFEGFVRSRCVEVVSSQSLGPAGR
jgi:hypothetical protein